MHINQAARSMFGNHLIFVEKNFKTKIKKKRASKKKRDLEVKDFKVQCQGPTLSMSYKVLI